MSASEEQSTSFSWGLDSPLTLALGWTVVVIASLTFNYYLDRQTIREYARIEAISNYRKDILYRRWATGHGGVYAPVTDQTPPNPYLKDIPERDITTPSGKALTLINPAYMTRQVHELGQSERGPLGHITSLNPIRPENAADPWETKALQQFAKGSEEFYSIEAIQGQPYLRLMRPLAVEQGCLKCHAAQGYRLGDLRGGISVSIPLGPYLAADRTHIVFIALGHGLLWVLGLGGIVGGAALKRRREAEKEKAEQTLRESEMRYRRMIALADAVAYEESLPDHKFVFFSEGIEKLTGYPPDELTAETWSGMIQECILRGDLAGLSLEEIRPRLASGEILEWRADYRIQDRSGVTRWLADCSIHVLDDAGRPVKALGILQDITERIRAERAVRASEERLRSVFRAAPVGIGVVRDRILIEVNDRICEMIGRSREELLSQSARILYPTDEDFEFVGREKYLQIRAWGTGTVETRWRRGDGEIIDVLLSSTPIHPEDWSLGVTFSALDITERKQAEQALRESEARYHALFTSMQEGFALHEIVCDAEGKPVDYRFVEINPAFERLTELKGEAIIGKTARECLPGVEEFWFEQYGKVALEGESLHLEHLSLRLNRWCEIYAYSPERGRFAVLMTDITERKKAEFHLSRFFEISPDLMCIAGMDGRFHRLSPAWEQTLGYKLEEIYTRRSIDFVHPEDVPSTIAAGSQILQGKRITLHQNRYRCADGSYRWIEWHTIPFGDEQLVFGVGRDVTDRKALEGQLRQAQKMEAVGQLAGGVAHDFNNLLQAINGYTDLAISEIPEGSHTREMLGEVAKAGHRAAELVSQLLAFSRRQVMKPESLNLNSVIADLMKMLGRVIPENIRLSFVPGHRLEPIYCDRGMIEQVIMNLCVNARDAMPEGGKLTLETANASIDEDFCGNHPWAQPGQFVLLTVSDTGYGMDKDTVSHLFEPFFTTKEVGKGTGLGLATVYGIVKQHEGMIHTYSEPGKGSAFRVYLPASERAEQEPENRTEGTVEGGTETILLAEDDEMVRGLAQRLLEKAGYTVLLARNGEEAVEIFEQHAHDVDLLLMDVVMPHLGGREAYERTRAIRSGVPVVFSSGYSEDAIHANFVLEQGLTLIQKPFSRETLLRAVRHALDEDRGKK